jgi:hypothetical protein
VIVAPSVAAVGCALAVSSLVAKPPGWSLLWWVAVIGTGIAAYVCVRRFERHGLAFAALLEMAIVFPVRPPSRLDVVIAARRPGVETQARQPTSGNGSGTKQAAIALAAALRAFDQRTRTETPVLQRVGVGAVAVSIATIIASLTLGGPAAIGRASRSRHSFVGGAAQGPGPAAVASGPPASAARSPVATGLAPTVPTGPAGPPTALASIEPALHASSATAAPTSAQVAATGAAVGGGPLGSGGAPTIATATATAPVPADNSGARNIQAPGATSAAFGTSTGNGGTVLALAVRSPSLASASGTPRRLAFRSPRVPGNDEVSAPPGNAVDRDLADTGNDGGGQPQSDAPPPAR